MKKNVLLKVCECGKGFNVPAGKGRKHSLCEACRESKVLQKISAKESFATEVFKSVLKEVLPVSIEHIGQKVLFNGTGFSSLENIDNFTKKVVLTGLTGFSATIEYGKEVYITTTSKLLFPVYQKVLVSESGV